MDFDIGKIIKNVSQIKLSGGVFGKTCTVLMVIAFAMLGISWAVKEFIVSILALVLISGISFPILWRLISFAEKNPQSAILDGAEFIVHQRIELAAKGIKILPNLPEEKIEDEPVKLNSQEILRLEKPDEENQNNEGEKND